MILYLLLINIFNYGADEVWIELKDNIRIINARKNVYVQGENFRISSDSAVLYETEDIDSAYLFKNVLIETEKFKIFSNKVFYDFIKRRGIFEKNVKIETDTFKILGDKIFYDEKKDSAFTNEKVQIFDKVNNIEITGFFMNYIPSKRRGKIDSLLFIKIKEKEDTLLIKGRTLYFMGKNLKVKENVILKAKDFEGECDSLLWEEDRILLLGKNPLLKTENSHLKGKKIEIFIKERKIKEIFSEGESFLKTVSEKKDTLYLYSNILKIIFNDSLRPIKVTGKGKINGEVRK